MAFKALRVNINSVKMTSKHKRRLSLAGVKAMSCVWCCDIYTAKQHVLHSFFISLTLILLLLLQEESFWNRSSFWATTMANKHAKALSLVWLLHLQRNESCFVCSCRRQMDVSNLEVCCYIQRFWGSGLTILNTLCCYID